MDRIEEDVMAGTEKHVIEIATTIVVSLWFGVASSHAAPHRRVLAESITNDSRSRMATGKSHSCLVRENGTVWCWGENRYGQLGDGTTLDHLSPVSVGGIINIVAVTAGYWHTCALQADGHVWCWGDNDSGQIGDGSTVDRPNPVLVNISNVVAIGAGQQNTCTLIGDGSVRCWGASPGGPPSPSPTSISGISNGTGLAVGPYHTCALLATGSVRCWGENFEGQLGDGTTTDRSTPVGVVGLSSAVEIAAGERHTCALIANGGGRCWGYNFDGRLGNGSTVNSLTPTAVIGLKNATSIVAGFMHTCALVATGSVRCWGGNIYGELGDGTNVSRLTPVPVMLPSVAIAVVASASGFHTCAMLVDGSRRCWGLGDDGQLGNGTRNRSAVPTTVLSPPVDARNALKVAAGSAHSCAVRADSTVACWGDSSFGQTGDIDVSDQPRLTPVAAHGVIDAVAVATGFAHSCALLVDGTVRCWGDNGAGQLGDGTTTTRRLPAPVNGLTNAIAISGGNAHTCALLANGTVRCWGFNTSGQGGNGTASSAVLLPTQVSGLNGVTAIAAGGTHTCALRFDGSIRCWGSNANGQLGDGTTARQLTSVAVTGLTKAVAVAAGDFHSCAALADGTARCWGGNFNGSLGDGTTTARLTPVAVSLASLTPGPAFATTIAAGSGHTCALLADGTGACWGDNAFGKLGDGTTTDRFTPVRVLLTNSGPLATGMDHTCTVAADGVPRCWGDNSFGQIGDGTTLPRLTPKRVSSF